MRKTLFRNGRVCEVCRRNATPQALSTREIEHASALEEELPNVRMYSEGTVAKTRKQAVFDG